MTLVNALAFYLLTYIEESMPREVIYNWGYCKSPQPIRYHIGYRCADGHRPESAQTEWMVQTMQEYPTLNTFLILLPYELPYVAAGLVAYSYFSRGRDKIK